MPVSSSHAGCITGGLRPQVYLASASPPVKYPNFYGVDLPSRKEFVANGLTQAEARGGASRALNATPAAVNPHLLKTHLHSSFVLSPFLPCR